MRAHLYQVITDDQGNIQPGTQVRLLTPDAAPGDAQPYPGKVWATKTGPDALDVTFTADTGVIDVWLDAPDYVMLGLTPVGASEYFIDNVAAGSIGGGNDVYVQPEAPTKPNKGTIWCDSDAPSGEQTETALFSYAGTPSSQTSPPYRPTFTGFITQTRVTAGTAASADSTIHLYIDGAEVITRTLDSGATVADFASDASALPSLSDQQVLTCSVQPGKGLADLVLQVVIST